MNPFKKSKLAKAAVLALSLTAVPLSMPVFAQTTTAPDRPTPVVTEDHDGNWGWLGLLGLIGLAGLAGLRKRDRGVVSHSTSRT